MCYTSYTCNECGASCREDIVDALGHNYNASVVTEPSCTEKGYTTHTCDRCGDSYKDGYVASLGHKYEKGKCVHCSAKKLNVSFADVLKQAWYREAVEYAVSYGLMNGMGNNTFEPDTPTTRAMLVTVLWRYEGSPEEGKNMFTDVKSGQWFTEAVAWAAKNEIVSGMSDNKFEPDGTLTREQLATIIFRYAKMCEIDPSARADFTKFEDGKKVQSWSKEAMQWAVAEGIIGGTSENGKLYLDPQGNATRAQVATILMRFIEKVLK